MFVFRPIYVHSRKSLILFIDSGKVVKQSSYLRHPLIIYRISYVIINVFQNIKQAPPSDTVNTVAPVAQLRPDEARGQSTHTTGLSMRAFKRGSRAMLPVSPAFTQEPASDVYRREEAPGG